MIDAHGGGQFTQGSPMSARGDGVGANHAWDSQGKHGCTFGATAGADRRPSRRCKLAHAWHTGPLVRSKLAQPWAVPAASTVPRNDGVRGSSPRVGFARLRTTCKLGVLRGAHRGQYTSLRMMGCGLEARFQSPRSTAPGRRRRLATGGCDRPAIPLRMTRTATGSFTHAPSPGHPIARWCERRSRAATYAASA